MSPQSTFPLGKDKIETSYADYFKQKYGLRIKETNQPLVISKDKKTNKEIALMPELCNLTGLTDGMRANFGLMKQLGSELHKSGQVRLQ